MSKPLTPGEKARRANIRKMKALGIRNAKARREQAVENFLAHVEAMNQRSVDAAAARAERRAAGIAKRDAHNARLHADKVRTLAGQLLEIATSSDETAATAQSPVTAGIYAIDAREKRDLARSILSTIGEQLPKAA